MERMEEAIPEADHQALHPMLSESAWPERAVLDQVAQDANRLLGGHTDSALLIDESGCPKKGTQSVGVARQWCGPLGKVENGQVGVFAALSRGTEATWIDGRLFLPEDWIGDAARCQAAGLPRAQRGFQRKTDLALAMVAHARQQGLGFAWVGFDGFYGSDPAFLRALDHQGEVFVGDVHQDQRIYLEDPRPIIPSAQTARGRPSTRLQAQTPAVRVDDWTRQQPITAWQSVTLRDGTQGPLRVDILHQRVWLWDGEEAQTRPWHLIVRREIDDPAEIKYSLSNAAADTPAPRLAFMQGQRYWNRTRLAAGPTGRGSGRLPGPGLAGLAPPHDLGHDGDAVPAGRTSASPADPTVVERSGYPGVVEPLLAAAGHHARGGPPPDGGAPPQTAGGDRFRLPPTAT
jgi:SRSO17 transposase